MRVVLYPDSTEDQVEGGGPIRRFFKELKKEHPPDLWTSVRETLEKVERSSNLKDLERQKWVEKLKKVKEPIFEFRIPPGKRKGGVVRLYFAYKPNEPNTIILLSAEKKSGTTEADKEKIQQAITRFREITS
jgi:hypothetical protein